MATIIDEWFEQVWNLGRTEGVHRLMASDGIIHHLDESGEDAHGADEFLVFFNRFRGAFPDIHFQVQDVVASGEKIACRWTCTGTHRGDHLGMPATGRPVHFEGMCIVRVADGKLAEGWNVWDTAAMNRQLTAPPTAAG